MTYMSEIAPTQIRGAMLSAFALSFALGQFFIAMGLQILFKVSLSSHLLPFPESRRSISMR